MGKKRQHPVSTCDMRTLTLIDAIGRCKIVRIVTKCFPVVLLRRLSDARTNRTRNVVIVQAYIPQTIETNACIYIIYIYISIMYDCVRACMYVIYMQDDVKNYLGGQLEVSSCYWIRC
jgi:hypothetical protein